MGNLVSVIIPTYNRAHIIVDAISSVLAQNYQNFEIIVVDDGSTDNTSEIVNQFDDLRVKYLYQQNSGKPSIARNLGIKNANGDYIAFLDSDDLWKPEFLQKHMEVFAKNPNVGFTLSWNHYVTFDGNIMLTRTCRAKDAKEFLKYILLHPDRVYTGPSASVIKKECFDNAGVFDETMTFSEDWELYSRLAIYNEMYNVRDFLTKVRVHKSLTSTDDVSYFKFGYLYYLEKSFKNPDLSAEMYKLKNKAYSSALWNIGGWALYRSKDYKVAKECLWGSLKNSYLQIFNLKLLIALSLCYCPKSFLSGYNCLRKKYRSFLGKN